MTQAVAALAWCPFPNRELAREVARTLLSEKLIACANLIGEVESIFQWEEEIAEGKEVAVLFKTTSERLDRLTVRLGELHPYDTPAVLGWHCDASLPATLEWLGSTVQPG